jgi:WhiB family redox-sensing transcriptional regulator
MSRDAWATTDPSTFHVDRPEWMDHGACVGANADLFFPPRGTTAPIKEAKAICADCPVRHDCLEWAIDHHEVHGVWGGTSAKERRVMRASPSRQRPINHGTGGGYQTHLRRGEPACRACLDAHNEYKRSLS